MKSAIRDCLHADPVVRECADVNHWWQRWRADPLRTAAPCEQAIGGGFAADRVGWAFASGYQAALRALVADLPSDAVAAFCVTEEGGNRPRDIRTRFTPGPGDGVTIDGAKRWTTLGPSSTWLLVIGALPAQAEALQPQLRVARVCAQADGVRLQPMPATAFVPEVPHARVQLDAVRVAAEALLPGDGYSRYVKPFRTIEDVHVTLAVIAYLLREARLRRWPRDFAERATALLVAFAELACSPPDAPATHVALAGAAAWAHRLYDEASALWAMSPEDPASARWRRDVSLFGVAGRARQLRGERAWQRLQGIDA
jgi:hypothetical protein